MDNISLKPFNTYIEGRGIRIVDSFQQVNSYDSKEHLSVICDFHKKVQGYMPYFGMEIKSSIGRSLEQRKKDIRLSKKFMESEKDLEAILNRAVSSISIAEKSDYLSLIKRSMRKNEICIGNSLPSNLSRQSNILIISLKDISYNMVEMDGIYYLSKIKKNISKEYLVDLVKFFCIEEGLDRNSESFMRAFLSYPKESMKCINRYISDESISKEEFLYNLKKSIIKDGVSII